MRLFVLLFLIIGSLGAQEAAAEDVSIQPLTRVDCDKAGMAWDEKANVCAMNAEPVSGQPLTRFDCERAGMPWNDNANVCGSKAQVAEQEAKTMPNLAPTETSSQPLTRSDCSLAGMTWNETANVCDENLAGSATQTASEGTNPVVSAVLVNIDKTRQRMTVFLDGVERYVWPVSTGQAGYSTPSGTYAASSMNEIWYSRQWDNAPMPHAVFFTREGHAIHGTNEVKRLGKPASHGCVRVSPQNAATLYALVAEAGLENTQVVLAGLTPGGEGKWASSARPKARYVESDVQPQRRGGFFKRLFGRR
jgi:lipoprotein-anchoring transpeptidase ErfK/SrfK